MLLRDRVSEARQGSRTPFVTAVFDARSPDPPHSVDRPWQLVVRATAVVDLHSYSSISRDKVFEAEKNAAPTRS